MTLDELITALIEARDHCVPGTSKVICDGCYIDNIKFDNKNVYLYYE